MTAAAVNERVRNLIFTLVLPVDRRPSDRLLDGNDFAVGAQVVATPCNSDMT
jgi:hypothetical protein